MNTTSLTAEREHLENLLEAAQRCTHFMHASASKIAWPLNAGQPCRGRTAPQLPVVRRRNIVSQARAD